MVHHFLKFIFNFLHSIFLKPFLKKKLSSEDKEKFENFLAEQNFGGSYGQDIVGQLKKNTLEDIQEELKVHLQETLVQHEKWIIDVLFEKKNIFHPCIFLGVNGVGKTTIMGKLFGKILDHCLFSSENNELKNIIDIYKKENNIEEILNSDNEMNDEQKNNIKTPLLRFYIISGDTFRAAAQEQLFHWIFRQCKERKLFGVLEKWDFSNSLTKKPHIIKLLEKNNTEESREYIDKTLEHINSDHQILEEIDNSINKFLSITFFCGAKDPGILLYSALEVEKNYLLNNISNENKGQAFLLMDTSGRLPNNNNLMNELSKLGNILQKYKKNWPEKNNIENNEHSLFQEEIILCCDATSGQHLTTQGELFNKSLSLTGLIFNKVDAYSKLGSFSKMSTLYPNLPFYALGTGEKPTDIKAFHVKDFL